MKNRALLVLLLATLLLVGCGTDKNLGVETINLASMQWLDKTGSEVRLAAPLHTFDARYSYSEPTEDGSFTVKTTEETLFPTMVWVVSDPASGTPAVLLARSPHWGCLIEWDRDQQYFYDPCGGSRFDRSGRWTFGPSPRGMDHLQAEVRDDFLWVTNQITYGDPAP